MSSKFNFVIVVFILLQFQLDIHLLHLLASKHLQDTQAPPFCRAATAGAGASRACGGGCGDAEEAGFDLGISWRTNWSGKVSCISRWWQLKHFLFSPLPGEMIKFDKHIFQLGWNHQLDLNWYLIFPNRRTMCGWIPDSLLLKLEGFLFVRASLPGSQHHGSDHKNLEVVFCRAGDRCSLLVDHSKVAKVWMD